mmetsp:Transcript_21249/g.59081  ORF Transcript_21249/g.59081 Transcript_21249/m.59081 type:complete len:271 (-) Transcript_21249:1022-1834(-)
MKMHNESMTDHWTPGGDILAMHTQDGHHWSNPQALLHHPTPGLQGGAPFVTANPPVATASGTWVLPFWQEAPRRSVCDWSTDSERAGVLVSPDRGQSWAVSQPIKANGTWLIEGTIVAFEDGELLQLFRTSRGKIYQSCSSDDGHTWSEPKPTDLPNPNSKVAAVVLSNGEVVLAYNARRKGDGYPKASRPLLFLATSATRGRTWTAFARLEMGLAPGIRFHYPALLQVGCKLLVSYSVGWKEGYRPGSEHGSVRTGLKLQILHLGLRHG